MWFLGFGGTGGFFFFSPDDCNRKFDNNSLLRPKELPLGGGGGLGGFWRPLVSLTLVGIFSFLSKLGLYSSDDFILPFFLDFLGGGSGVSDDDSLHKKEECN